MHFFFPRQSLLPHKHTHIFDVVLEVVLCLCCTTRRVVVPKPAEDLRSEDEK